MPLSTLKVDFMASRSQGILVNVAGLLYASLGFCLSVLAALVALCYRKQPERPPLQPPKLRLPSNPTRGRRFQRSTSDQSLNTSVTVVTTRQPKETSSDIRNKKDITLKRRSRSLIPIITIDYFGSTDNLHTSVTGHLQVQPRISGPAKPLPKPLPFIITQQSDPVQLDRESSHNRGGFSFSNLRPSWTKEGKDRPLVKRRQSSPQLCHAPPLPAPLCHKARSSDGSTSSRPTATLHKMPSTPGMAHEKVTTKFDPSFFRRVEKKQSLPLRTKPYEAPYFAPPPLPISHTKPHVGDLSKGPSKKKSNTRIGNP